MATTAATYLKYANLQMAAEATRLDEVRSGSLVLEDALKFGNNRASKFTDVAAAEFSQLWEVVEHKSNTTTGFSGALFKCKSGGGADVDALRARNSVSLQEAGA